MRKMVLLTVGPVMISEEARNALLQPDLCHREVEFAEILNGVRAKLKNVFKGNDRHTVIVFGGSGTAALEGVISSVMREGKLLVLSNGYYGEKIAEIARIHEINTSTLRYNWGEGIRRSDVENSLRSDPEIEFVSIVHNETSTGMLNDVTEIGELTSEYKKVFVVDAISSIGLEDLDIARDNIQFCIGSPNKCIESIPGLSFVCAEREKIEELRNLPPRTSYLDLYTHYLYEEGLGERIGTPFTPPVHAFYALDVALGLLLKEGIENRRRRYAFLASLVREGLQKLGFRLLLRPEQMCNSITSLLTPRNIPYRFLHDKLKENNFVIYAGQGNLEEKIFRVGNMGVLSTEDIGKFLESLGLILEELGNSPRY